LCGAAASDSVTARTLSYTFYHLGIAGTSGGVHQPLSISTVPQSGSIGTVIGFSEHFNWPFEWVGNTPVGLFASPSVVPTAISQNGAYASLGSAPGFPCSTGYGFVPQQGFFPVGPGPNQCLTFWGVNNNGVFVGDGQLIVGGKARTEVFRASCSYSLGCSSAYYFGSSLGGSYSSARAINNLDEFVGVSTTASGISRAFYIIPSTGQLQDFDPGNTAYSSVANAINDSGTAVGTLLPGRCPPFPSTCVGSSSNTYPVVFPAIFGGASGVTSVTSLGSLGGLQGAALSINAAGTIVGWSAVHSGQAHGFFYVGGVMTDLNTIPLYDSTNQRVLGWTITEADGINDAGQIVGRAIYPLTGKEEVVVLVP
jgi:probable HAF family extracellular repeat protein